MSVALNEVGRTGELELVFAEKRGKTILEDIYYEVPFKVTKLSYPPASHLAQLILMTPTAGLFGGDQLSINIHVKSGAAVRIVPQGATKVHPSLGRSAVQNVKITVDPEGELHLWNDPLIPFKDARLRQHWTIQLYKKSRFYFWDAFSSGRIHHGEQWEFEELFNETRVYVDQTLAYLDRYQIKPQQQHVDHLLGMSYYQYLATLLLFDDKLVEDHTHPFQKLLSSSITPVAAGVDIPYPSLLAGRILTENGACLRKLQERAAELLFDLLLPAPCPAFRK
ncbi:MAG: urease accessory protein UreD [SAR324 cluster bacterium]|nr:urease accessory protein UreD [SAR324 cluster bacterium]